MIQQYSSFTAVREEKMRIGYRITVFHGVTWR